ncbi:MAG: glucose 1-dehydrogenase [Proteobacteria bacterium]|nr:glucose 1-dehydrogenase [Pseudomonadota bacterium]MDA0952270.1 glucose 1-dehydrogenase [Pseudomonadota bacterium]
MSGRLKNKVALVTGGASGFGRQSAIRLAEEGALVCITDLNEAGGEETAAMLGPRGFFRRQDVTREDDWTATIKAVLDRFAKLDVLVNSAGVAAAADNIEDADDAIWDLVMDVNLTGTWLGCRHAIAPMRRAGGGSIINLASVLALKGEGGALAYCASKGGVRLLTKSVAVHCGNQRNNIRCNAICPGYMLTGMLRDFLDSLNDREGEHARIAAMHPLGRLGDADDIAQMVLYLASDESRFVTGAEMIVDGGFTAG